MDIDVSEPFVARVPFRTVLASLVGLWLCYFLLVTIRSELFDLGFEQEMLWRRAIASAAGVVIMVGLWLILRLVDTRPLWVKIAAALLLSLPVALALAESNQLAFAPIEERVLQRMAAQQGLVVRRDASGDLLVDVSVPGVADSGGQRSVTIDRERAWENLAEIALGAISWPSPGARSTWRC